MLVRYHKSHPYVTESFNHFLKILKLVMYTEVRWLSRDRCLDRFFSLRTEIALFIDPEFPNSKTNQSLIEKLKSLDFLKSLAFLTDLSKHINNLKLHLQ